MLARSAERWSSPGTPRRGRSWTFSWDNKCLLMTEVSWDCRAHIIGKMVVNKRQGRRKQKRGWGEDDGFVSNIQFSSVAQLCPTLCDSMNHSTPGLPVHHQLPELTQTHIHRVSDAIQPSHPLSSPSPLAPLWAVPVGRAWGYWDVLNALNPLGSKNTLNQSLFCCFLLWNTIHSKHKGSPICVHWHLKNET